MKSTTENRAVVSYERISDDKRGSAEGVESQHQDNEEIADEVGAVITTRYTDNDLSAFSGVERPEYQRLTRDMAAGKIAMVIIWHANRLLRSTMECDAFIKLARANKVKLCSYTKGGFYNLDKASGRKELRDDVNAAQYESEHRGERVSLARKRQARQGAYGGGVRPYGWGVDTGRVRSVCANPKAPPMERRYEDRPVLDMTQHNPTEADEIRGWARDLLAGVKMAHVLRSLAEREVPTQGQTDGRDYRRHGQSLTLKGWGSRTVASVLLSPRTVGHAEYKGTITNRNAYKPIINEADQKALRALLTDPTRKTSPGNTPKWLLSLTALCGQCDDGSSFTVRGRPTGPTYRCAAKGHCLVPAAEADQFVTDAILARLSRDDVTDLLPTNQRNDVDYEALQAEIVTLEANKRNVGRLLGLGKIDEEMAGEAKSAADERIAEVRAQLQESVSDSPLGDLFDYESAEQWWDAISLGRKREVVKALLMVTFHPAGRGRRLPLRELISIAFVPQLKGA
jgi:site-specific DNA recombinase